MDIVKMDIDAIIPYENNPRKNDKSVKKVARSLKEFGWQQPIVIDKQNVIIVGHTRYKAAKSLKLKKVPVVIAANLTEKQVKAYRLADNRLNQDSEWDEFLLASEFQGIDEIDPDFDFTLLGFENDEIGDIFVKDFSNDNDENDDNVPSDFLKKAITQKGDIWQLGKHILMCGDATRREDIEKLIGNEDKSKIFVITDPPYGISIVNKNGKIGSHKLAKLGNYKIIKGDQDTETCKKTFEIIKSMFEKIIFFGGNYFLDFLPPSDGWIIWDKRCDNDLRNNFADGEMAWCNFHTPVRIYRQLWIGMIREGKGEHEKRIHPTQKPVNLFENIIKDFAKRNEIILDLFGGSGSLLISCEKINQKCCMMEFDIDYCDNIIRRWQKITKKEAINIKSNKTFNQLLKK